MKTYRTYRYGELAYLCICNGANKRDKQTKRMYTRDAMTGWDKYRHIKTMRKGSSK
jgi:hypothetical protein